MSREHYIRKVFYSKEDGEWIAVAPELRGCSASGATDKEALKELEGAIDLWLKGVRELGWDIPEPVTDREPSGKYLLRLPKSLQKELTAEAAEEGISLNQYLL